SVRWSAELCSDAERTLWGRLAVFRAGFDLEAARYVCGDQTQISFNERMLGLIDKSIISRADKNASTPRFLLLETMRDYAENELTEDELLAEVRLRHAEWYRSR